MLTQWILAAVDQPDSAYNVGYAVGRIVGMALIAALVVWVFLKITGRK